MKASDTRIKPCQCLRTKNPHGTTASTYESWHPTVASTSTFWCLRSMSFAGPDDHYVHLSRCQPGRSCYQEPED